MEHTQQDNRTINVDAVLGSWKLRIGFIIMLLSPAVAAMGAFYNLKADMTAQVSGVKAEVSTKLAEKSAQLDARFVTKDSFTDLKDNVKEVKDDVKDIKNLLMRRPGK